MFHQRERSRNVIENGLKWAEGRKQLKKVQLLANSDAILSSREAVPDDGRGVRCHWQLVEVPSQTLSHLVLAGPTGEYDVVHQKLRTLSVDISVRRLEGYWYRRDAFV